MENIVVKQFNLKDDAKDLKKIYKESFPKVERVGFKELFSSVFKDFKMFCFYDSEVLLGFAHLLNSDNFIHLNYLAVNKNFQNEGVGSSIINWIKMNFNNKPIVADVENIDVNAKNAHDRFRRLHFYYKNGFFDGKSEFDWNGTKMYYIITGYISDVEFMDHIKNVFQLFVMLDHINQIKIMLRVVLKSYKIITGSGF